jgi:protein-L-isoaspartate(D-aspartate) O-methyltransferase
MADEGRKLLCDRRRLRRLAKVLRGLVCFALIGLNLSGCPSRKSGDDKGSGGRPAEKERPAQVERRHPAFRERVEERIAMVRHQIEARQVRDSRVLEAMRIVPRHAFVPREEQPNAYADCPLPIGQGQTISQPYIVAFMTEALGLNPNSVVLEIGTGSGYQAAVAAEIAKAVYTIEIVGPLARSSAELLKSLGYENIHVKAGDGYYGWPENGPFDAIIGTAAARQIPPLLVEQLKEGGRMILPVSGEFGFQYLVLLTKDHGGELHQEKVMPVLFVPMTGEIQTPSDSPKPSRNGSL